VQRLAYNCISRPYLYSYMLMCFIFAFSPLNNIVRVYMYELDLDLDLYPALNWTHWAILRRHPCLSRAATSASSQVNPICMANNSAAVRSAYRTCSVTAPTK